MPGLSPILAGLLTFAAQSDFVELPAELRAGLKSYVKPFSSVDLSYVKSIRMTPKGKALLEEHELTVNPGSIRIEITYCNGRWYRLADYLLKDRPHQQEDAFDGSVHYRASLSRGAPVAISMRFLDAEARREPEGLQAVLIHCKYFEAIGIAMPTTIAAMQQHAPPEPVLFEMLAKGARVERIQKLQEGTQRLWRVELVDTDSELRHRLVFDPLRGYCLKKQEVLTLDGSLMIAFAMSDFEKMEGADCWLPMRCRIQEHYRKYLPPQGFPLVETDIRVTRAAHLELPASRFVLKYDQVPGVWVFNGIRPEAADFPGGEIAYQAPASPEDLERVIRRMRRSYFRSPVTWSVAGTAALLLTVYSVRVWKRRRTGKT